MGSQRVRQNLATEQQILNHIQPRAPNLLQEKVVSITAAEPAPSLQLNCPAWYKWSYIAPSSTRTIH